MLLQEQLSSAVEVYGVNSDVVVFGHELFLRGFPVTAALPRWSHALGRRQRAQCRCVESSLIDTLPRSFFVVLGNPHWMRFSTACRDQLHIGARRLSYALCDLHRLGSLQNKFLLLRGHSTHIRNRTSVCILHCVAKSRDRAFWCCSAQASLPHVCDSSVLEAAALVRNK